MYIICFTLGVQCKVYIKNLTLGVQCTVYITNFTLGVQCKDYNGDQVYRLEVQTPNQIEYLQNLENNGADFWTEVLTTFIIIIIIIVSNVIIIQFCRGICPILCTVKKLQFS